MKNKIKYTAGNMHNLVADGILNKVSFFSWWLVVYLRIFLQSVFGF